MLSEIIGIIPYLAHQELSERLEDKHLAIVLMVLLYDFVDNLPANGVHMQHEVVFTAIIIVLLSTLVFYKSLHQFAESKHFAWLKISNFPLIKHIDLPAAHASMRW